MRERIALVSQRLQAVSSQSGRRYGTLTEIVQEQWIYQNLYILLITSSGNFTSIESHSRIYAHLKLILLIPKSFVTGISVAYVPFFNSYFSESH